MLCPLTVGGSFEASTTAVTGEYQFAASATEPGAGAFAVDLASLDTGIGLRNQHLRDTYLEVGKGEGYARAVLSQIRLTGVDGTGPSGKGRFSGLFALHGVERPVEGTVEVRRNGGGVRTRATFSVVLATFGIAAPRYLGVGVKDTVTVQVQLDADAEGSGR